MDSSISSGISNTAAGRLGGRWLGIWRRRKPFCEYKACIKVRKFKRG
jgi:hypothetical protein